MTKNSFYNAATGVMVVCAVIVTGLVIRKEFFPPSPKATLANPVKVKRWQNFAAVGTRIGSPAAPVKIIVFTDFQCPACRRLASQLQAVREEYPRDVQIIVRHYPLEQIHPLAKRAALASECAAQQGRFAAYHDALFESQGSLGSIPWTVLAAQVGVRDTATFRQCVDTGRFAARLREDVTAGQALEISGTPTTIIDGRMFTGVGSPEGLQRLVSRAVERHRGS